MAIEVNDVQLGVRVSAYGADNVHLGEGTIEGYCCDGKVVGQFPEGACRDDMVFVNLSTELPHPKIMSATMYLGSVSLVLKA